MELAGMYALVTGASGGIGFHIAKRFLEEGALVGLHYHRNRAQVEKLVDMAPKGHCRVFEADFAESHDVLQLWDQFLAWSGTIDTLVNNAGEIADPAPMNELTEEAWDRTFQINVKAPFLLSQAAMRVMKPKCHGRIINMSSIGVKFGGGRTTAHYNASKAALEALSRSLAKDGATYNVLVNSIEGGITDTPLHEKMGRTDLPERVELIPMKRMARPEEIAEMALFLASERSSFITGATLPVSGGE